MTGSEDCRIQISIAAAYRSDDGEPRQFDDQYARRCTYEPYQGLSLVKLGQMDPPDSERQDVPAWVSTQLYHVLPQHLFADSASARHLFNYPHWVKSEAPPVVP